MEELSKGMAQKLQFIVTILHDPELLILDEPFSGLDPLNIELVKDIILERKREGMTIIYSTHLMEYAEKTVDSLVMIDQGRKVLDGTLAAVKAEYGKKFIRVQYEGDARFVAGPALRHVAAATRAARWRSSWTTWPTRTAAARPARPRRRQRLSAQRAVAAEHFHPQSPGRSRSMKKLFAVIKKEYKVIVKKEIVHHHRPSSRRC